jgi:hypothetical protein
MAVPKPSQRSSLSLSGSSHLAPLHPVRRASEFDINYPPRYSTLVAPSNAVPNHGPPAYSSVFQRAQSLESADARPHIQRQSPLFPASHPRNLNGVHSHHSYHIIGSKTEPWATLKVYSPSSSHHTPYFTSGDLIRGSLELNLDTPQNISSVSLSVSKNNVVT